MFIRKLSVICSRSPNYSTRTVNTEHTHCAPDTAVGWAEREVGHASCLQGAYNPQARDKSANK